MLRTSTITGVILVGLLGFFPTRALGQEVKGQLRIGIHKFQLEKGKMYQVIVESSEPAPPLVNVDFRQGSLVHFHGKDFKDDKIYFFPSRTDDYTFYVFPPFGNPKGETIDYTLKFKAKTLADKPILEDKYSLTDKDPVYAPPGGFGPKDSYSKAYKVRLKAGQLYIIDMVRSDNKIDPYLYLEGPDGKVAAQDDDSGGNLNARIIYIPQQDGEYRVIATTLFRATGEYTLTVRTAKD